MKKEEKNARREGTVVVAFCNANVAEPNPAARYGQSTTRLSKLAKLIKLANLTTTTTEKEASLY